MQKYHVWVKDAQGDSCLVERASWNDALENLNGMVLSNGLVPEWVESIRFYESFGGDIPVAVYHAGDIIERKSRGRASEDKATRGYTLDKQVAAWLDAMPDGERSQFVNRVLREAMPQIGRA